MDELRKVPLIWKALLLGDTAQAMSQENVETVRHLYELMTRGDDGMLELVAPDFVVDFSRRLIDPFVTRVDPDAFGSFFSGGA